MDVSSPTPPNPFSQLPSDKTEGALARVLKVLKKEYVIVGRSRVNVFRSWLAIGLVAGIAVGIIFVANRSGELEPSVAGPVKEQTEDKKFVRGQILVSFKDNVEESEGDEDIKERGYSVKKKISGTKVKVVNVPEGREEEIVAAFVRNPRVEFAELDTILPVELIPNDTSYSSQWHHEKIGSPLAWDRTTGSSSIIIAILDTGVDGIHPDLSLRMVPGNNFVSENTNTSDWHGHGTKVAGTAAAIGNNGMGVAGVSWQSKIMPMVACNSGGFCGTSDITASVTWAADHGARVINMSIGGVADSPSVKTAADYARSKGAVVIAGSGNCSCMESTPENTSIISIGATKNDDTIASFSSKGEYVDLSAPGVSILTTTRGGGYAAVDGTSYSGPVVSGVSALMLALKPSLTPTEVETILQNTADDKGQTGHDTSFGWGRVNAGRALATVQGASLPPPDTSPPTISITSPTSGSTVSGDISVDALASDNVGVVRTEFFKQGVKVFTDTTFPYGYFWQTNENTNGSYTWQTKAYDSAGNIGNSSTITVTVNNSVPPPPTSSEIIIDNGKIGSSRTGSWCTSVSSGFYGTDSSYSCGNGADTYRWTPTISEGEFEVLVWWTTHENRSTNGIIQIRKADDTFASHIVNQQVNGGKWNSLGTYVLGPGSYVETNDSNGQVAADAVRFVSKGSVLPPPPPAAAEIIIDNGKPGTTRVGTWIKSVSTNFYGTDSFYSDETSSRYRWTPTLPSAGSYDVYFWYTTHRNRSTNVPVTVQHKGGQGTKHFNEQTGGGQWILLGTYQFDAGTAGYVETSGVNGQAAADAVKFVPK